MIVALDEKLERISTEPGVYLFKDAKGTVIYVGKAQNLRNRVRQYFRPGGDERFFVAAGFLARLVDDIETIVVTSSKEALLLENHLIKKHQPRFNVKLRDDKQYLVLRLLDPVPGATVKREQFPRVQVVRNIRDDNASYFGPYHSATGARETLRTLNRHFQLRTCTDHVLETRGRPCLQYQIKRCSGPCAIDVAPEAYAEQVSDVKMFLGGKSVELVDRLRGRMAAQAEREQFEAAAVLRDSIGAVERTLAKQNIVQDDFVDQDVWGLFREADAVEVVVLFVRAGKLNGRRAFHQKDQELPDAAVIAEHVQQYYATGTMIPDEIVVGVDMEASDTLEEWLGTLRGGAKRVRIVEPRRGTRVRLVELADRNAAASAVSRRGTGGDADELLAKVAKRLELSRSPRRIECFDIAHISGTETVASMVTFIDGLPSRNLYRKFKVKTVENNDFAAMYEVLTRRFRRHADADGGGEAWAVPDLLVIDGGKGQLGMAVAALTDLGVVMGGETGVEVIGLAKERDLEAGTAPDRIYRRNVKDSIALRQNSPELFVLARIRDEAHRFANTFHRDRRSKATLRSELDDIPSIGPGRRKSLLKAFGSVRDVRRASVDDLAKVAGMTRKAAEEIAAYFASLAETADDATSEVPDVPVEGDLIDAVDA